MITMMWWNGGAGWVGWLLMSVGMVAFWVLVVIAIMALMGGVHDDSAVRDGRPAREENPGQVLDEQFARGELDVQDYQRRRGLLSQWH